MRVSPVAGYFGRESKGNTEVVCPRKKPVAILEMQAQTVARQECATVSSACPLLWFFNNSVAFRHSTQVRPFVLQWPSNDQTP